MTKQIPDTIGRYEAQRPIGKGGMGLLYPAEAGSTGVCHDTDGDPAGQAATRLTCHYLPTSRLS